VELMTGKTVAITGASSGIGLATARQLAAMGARIVAVVRDRAKAEAALEGLAHDVVVADLYSLAEVRHAGAEIRRRFARLDVLIHNAGGIHAERELTAEGFERTFALNHLAAFQLTYELRELLAASAPSRIVTVSSMGHRFASFRWDELATMERWTGPTAVYGASKLCNIWFAREAARRLARANVTSCSLHPGAVASGFGRGGPWVYRVGTRLVRPFLKTAEEGARTSVYVASSPELEGASGLYFVDCHPAKPSRWARDDHEALRLWELSEQLCGVTWA
jgi:NAD(P)-dependent dehydrogenase (short-subunit alcohol dehydrogenase family)